MGRLISSFKKRWASQSSKHNHYIISPRVIIKTNIIILERGQTWARPKPGVASNLVWCWTWTPLKSGAMWNLGQGETWAAGISWSLEILAARIYWVAFTPGQRWNLVVRWTWTVAKSGRGVDLGATWSWAFSQSSHRKNLQARPSCRPSDPASPKDLCRGQTWRGAKSDNTSNLGWLEILEARKSVAPEWSILTDFFVDFFLFKCHCLLYILEVLLFSCIYLCYLLSVQFSSVFNQSQSHLFTLMLFLFWFCRHTLARRKGEEKRRQTPYFRVVLLIALTN